MAELIIMPKLGFNMSVGKLVQWYKNEGEAVRKGEAFFSIETDKTNMDIEATGDGIVRRLFIEAGDTVEVTLPIAVVGNAEENIDAMVGEALKKLGRSSAPDAHERSDGANAGLNAAESESATAANTSDGQTNQMLEETVQNNMVPGGRARITPRARRAARARNIDISTLNIAGTGFQGGICEADILAYVPPKPADKKAATPLALNMARVDGIDLSSVGGTGAGGKVTKKDVEAAASAARPKIAGDDSSAAARDALESSSGADLDIDGKEILERVPYAGIRRIIGERLSASKKTAPHLYFSKAVDLTKLLELRSQVNGAQGKKTSVTDYIAAAVVKTLQMYPDVNCTLRDDEIIKYKSVNLGIAVAAPGGLIVPVVKNAEKMSLVSLSEEASALFEKARKGKLTPAEYTGGTFTISNLGMYDIDNFTAIINQPESAILAISKTEKRAVVIKNANGEDEIAIRPIMNINLTVDHRVIDGLLAAQFVGQIRKYLEEPITLLV